MNAPTRSEFLARRRNGIGGSEIAAILGLSKYKTPLDVYLSKVNDPEDVEDEQSEPAYWGTVLEDIVAREYALRSRARIQRVNAQIRHPELPIAIANIDRAIVTPGSRARLDADGVLRGADGLLECKTANQFLAGEWGRDGDDEAVPVHYAAQGMWYLGVTGLDWIDYACLIGGQKFVTKRVHRDQPTIDSLFNTAREFWTRHVAARVPPEPVNAGDVLKLFPSDTGTSVEANEEVLIAYNEAVALRARIKADEEALESHTVALKAAMRDAASITLNGRAILTWKRAKDSTKTDWKQTAHDLKGWMIDNGIEGGVDAVRAAIDANTETIDGTRRFVFVPIK